MCHANMKSAATLIAATLLIAATSGCCPAHQARGHHEDDATPARVAPDTLTRATLFNPLDPAHEILNCSHLRAPAAPDQWHKLQLANVPHGATAVILNVYGHIRGFSPGSADVPSGMEPHISFKFRAAGTRVEPDNFSFAAYATSNEAYNVQQNTVCVPLDPNGAIEYKYQILLSGSPNDSGHMRVYVQGFLTAGK